MDKEINVTNPARASLIALKLCIDGSQISAICFLHCFASKLRQVKALRRKLKFTLEQGPKPGTSIYPLQNWLAGAPVALMFATATELADKMIPVPDDLLQCAAQQYLGISDSQSGCDTESETNTPEDSCMDDYTVAAAGFGWVAAYQKKMRGEMAAQPYVNRAKTLIK